jgi:hypothetical protein
VRVDEPWICNRPVDLDLVKVTMRAELEHAIYLKAGCSGRIGRIEVDTWQKDGVKVNKGAQDIVIGGGIIRCHARDDRTHQDGVQAQGGARVTFRNLTIDCKTANNAAFFVSLVGETPEDIVCDGCTLLPANSTVNIRKSVRSGVRNSTVCRGNTGTIRIQRAAVEPVNSANLVLSASDSRCQAGL